MRKAKKIVKRPALKKKAGYKKAKSKTAKRR
jgi:hypothetical protein